MNRKLLGIVSAGGYSARMNLSHPKSMQKVGGVTLLELTIRSLLDSGIHDIIVFTNRSDFVFEQNRLLHQFPGVVLLRDGGVESTIQLLNIALQIRNYDAYVFCYGHAPRPSGLIRAVYKSSKPLGGVVVPSSTRRDRIMCRSWHVEPPFYIKESLIRSTHRYSKWSELFYDHSEYTHCVKCDGPGEFNNLLEWELYQNYAQGYLLNNYLSNPTLKRTRRNYEGYIWLR